MFTAMYVSSKATEHPELSACPESSDSIGEHVGEEAPVHRAALQGDVERLNRLLVAGARPDSRLSKGAREGETPLHWAAIGNAPWAAECLIEAGGKPNATDDGGWTPLHRAAWWDSPEAARTLLYAGADPGARAGHGGVPLRWAALGGNASVAELLLQAGTDPKAGLEPKDAGKERDALRALLSTVAARTDTPEVLRKLADTPHRGVRRAVAENEAASEPLLETLATDARPEVREAAARRLPEDHDLMELLRKAGSRAHLAERVEGAPGSISEAERQRLLKAGPYGRELVAAHSTTEERILEQLVEDEEAAVRQAVASNPNLPPVLVWTVAEECPAAVLSNPARQVWEMENPGLLHEVPLDALKALLKSEQAPTQWLRWGSTHEDGVVRRAVAANPSTPAEILESLAGDEEVQVRRRVSRHANAPTAVLDLLMTAGSRPDLTGRTGERPGPLSAEERKRLLELGPYGRILVVGHPDTPAEKLRELAEHGGEAVRYAVASNSTAPAKVLETLIDDAESGLRKTIANNPAAPTPMLERLAADGNPDVRAEVISHSRSPTDLLNLMTRAGSRLDLSGRSEGTPEPLTESERQRLLDAGPFGRELVAAHPETPPETLRQLAARNSPSLRAAIVEHPAPPKDVQETLREKI